jgi:hypothetical protein
MKVPIPIHLETVSESTLRHLKYCIFDSLELAPNLLIFGWEIAELPLRMSQRGDSGRPGMKTRMTSASTIWKAMGKRQDMVLGSRKENPRSIQ